MKKRGIACELARTATKAEVTEAGVQVTLGPSPFVKGPSGRRRRRRACWKPTWSWWPWGRVAQHVWPGPGRGRGGDGSARLDQGPTRVWRLLCLASTPWATCLVRRGSCWLTWRPWRGLVAVAQLPGRIRGNGLLQGASGGVHLSRGGNGGADRGPGAGTRASTWPVPQSNFRELGQGPGNGRNWRGLFKLVVDADSGKIPGRATWAGAHVSDIIAEPTLAMQLGATAKDLARTIHAHPTLAEGIFETAHLL